MKFAVNIWFVRMCRKLNNVNLTEVRKLELADS